MYRFTSGLKYSGTTEKAISYLVFQSENEIGQKYFDQEYKTNRQHMKRSASCKSYPCIELYYSL